MATEQQVVYGVPEAAVKPPAASADASAPLQLTSERLRVWGARAVFSLLDQGLFSGAGFLVNLLLARWLAPDSYGAFAVAFAGFLFISGFHNVLLLEPLTVMGPGRHSENLPAYFRAQLLIHFILVGGLAIAGLLGGVVTWLARLDSPLVGAIFGTALMLPLLLLLWLVRRMCYALHRPGLAVAGTGSYLVCIIAGLAALRHFGWATPFLSFLLMGTASFVASGILLARIGFFRGPKKPGDISWRAALRENWTYGRWLVGSAVLYSLSSQVQIFFVSALLGLGAGGVLRAMQLPSLLMTQVITATGLLFLPILSRDFGNGLILRMRHKAALLNTGLCVIAAIFAGVLFLSSPWAEQLLFHGKYSDYSRLMPLLALVPVASAASTGYSMALRASARPHFDLLSNIIAAPVSVLSAILFVRWWGISGAAASMVLGFGVSSVVTIMCFRGTKWKD